MFSLYKRYDEQVDICKNNVGKLFSKLKFGYRICCFIQIVSSFPQKIRNCFS